jgi:hypothetical protein
MEEITLQVQGDEQSGILVAWWDDPSGSGGITTQGKDLRDLQQQITEAVAVHFDEGDAPRRIRVQVEGIAEKITGRRKRLPHQIADC